MAITIAHLYYDILNLYGESGNIKILKYALEKSGYKVIIKFVTVDDILEFDTYDLVYMGMGIPENFNIVIKHLKKYKKDIETYINNNKLFIATGNSYELFGKYNLHPAIITACKSLDELDIYLACLEDNVLDEFPFFEIKYEIAPVVQKA